MSSLRNLSWEKIFQDKKINEHDFTKAPFYITSKEIKSITKGFDKTSQTEPRLLCKHDRREDRPEILQDYGLFVMPVKNGLYALLKGDGYTDIPEIQTPLEIYQSKLDFTPVASCMGDSEMQHIDFAFACGLINHYIGDDNLVLSIRGRKYSKPMDFYFNHHLLHTESVQLEVDAGYESKERIVLIEAKNSISTNVITRQLYYPYRHWKSVCDKEVIPLFFEKRKDMFCLWQYAFEDDMRYNSAKLVDSRCFRISNQN